MRGFGVDSFAERVTGVSCPCTMSMEQAADRAEAAVVDHYFSSPTENISVPVCLWISGYRLMIVL